jgi:hypothetical protein
MKAKTKTNGKRNVQNNHPWLLKLIKNSSFSTDDYARLFVSWTQFQWQKKPLYSAVKMLDPTKSSPDSNSMELFSAGALDSSSSSSIIISRARQVKLQNAFSPLQEDIKQANISIKFYTSNNLLKSRPQSRIKAALYHNFQGSRMQISCLRRAHYRRGTSQTTHRVV